MKIIVCRKYAESLCPTQSRLDQVSTYTARENFRQEILKFHTIIHCTHTLEDTSDIFFDNSNKHISWTALSRKAQTSFMPLFQEIKNWKSFSEETLQIQTSFMPSFSEILKWKSSTYCSRKVETRNHKLGRSLIKFYVFHWRA